MTTILPDDHNPPPMTTILPDDHNPRSADAQWSETRCGRPSSGRPGSGRGHSRQDVRAKFAEVDPDLVVLDLQIGNMAGRGGDRPSLEESGGRLLGPHLVAARPPRRRFIARRADVDLTLVKPVDAGILRRAGSRSSRPRRGVLDEDDEDDSDGGFDDSATN